MKRIGLLLESLVVVVIIVALGHTFVEDFSILAGWTVAARRWIIWAGLGIDVFFTIEFFTRLYFALTAGQAADYLLRRRGLDRFCCLHPAPALQFPAQRACPPGRGGPGDGPRKLPECAQGHQGGADRKDPQAPEDSEAVPGDPLRQVPDGPEAHRDHHDDQCHRAGPLGAGGEPARRLWDPARPGEHCSRLAKCTRALPRPGRLRRHGPRCPRARGRSPGFHPAGCAVPGRVEPRGPDTTMYTTRHTSWPGTTSTCRRRSRSFFDGTPPAAAAREGIVFFIASCLTTLAFLFSMPPFRTADFRPHPCHETRDGRERLQPGGPHPTPGGG